MPETDPGAAPWTGAALKAISAVKKTRWSLRIITYVGDLAASLAFSSKSTPRKAPDLESGGPAARDTYYSTTKGADCAISCFEIPSFILIVTLYLPGWRPAIETDFSTVN
jgi:hypothetical protein